MPGARERVVGGFLAAPDSTPEGEKIVDAEYEVKEDDRKKA